MLRCTRSWGRQIHSGRQRHPVQEHQEPIPSFTFIYIHFPWKERFQHVPTGQVMTSPGALLPSPASSLALPAAVLASKRSADLIGSVCICSHVFVCHECNKLPKHVSQGENCDAIDASPHRHHHSWHWSSQEAHLWTWKHKTKLTTQLHMLVHHGKVNSAMLSLVAHSGERSGFSGPIVEKSSKTRQGQAARIAMDGNG